MTSANPNIDVYLDGIYSEWPDIASFNTILGTDYFGYVSAWFDELASKFSSLMALIGAFTIFPEISLYGQTMTVADNPIMGLINVGILGWLGFAVWERLPFMGV